MSLYQLQCPNGQQKDQLCRHLVWNLRGLMLMGVGR